MSSHNHHKKRRPETDSFTFQAGDIFYVIQFLFLGLCRQGFGCAFFSHSVGRHDQKDVNCHTHEARDRGAAANDRVDHVARREHQADDGEDKRGLCFARVFCRTAGKNSFREGKAAHEEHHTSGYKHEGTGHAVISLVLAAGNMIYAIVGGGATITGPVCVAVNVLLAVAANTVRKEGAAEALAA